METRPYNPSEAEPPPEPPPFPKAYTPVAQEREAYLPDEVDEEGMQVNPDRLAWSASHRKEAIDEDRNVKRHAERSRKAAEEDKPLEKEYEQRAEKRADFHATTQPEPDSATQVGEIARQNSEEYTGTGPTKKYYDDQPSQPAYNYTAPQPPQVNDSPRQWEDDEDQDEGKDVSIFSLVSGELFAVYKKYIIAGFFFGLVLLVAMLVVWLVVG